MSNNCLAKNLKLKAKNHNLKLKIIFVLCIAYRVHIYLDKLLCIFINTDFLSQTHMKLKLKTF